MYLLVRSRNEEICACMFCAGLGVQLVGGGARYVGQEDDQGLPQTDLGSIQLQ